MTDDKPLVSVVMGVYNEEDRVSDALDSILDGRFDDLEIVVVDDGSTDNTTTVMERVPDPRVRLLQRETNRGLAASLNDGIRSARGKYVARMDADDHSYPDRLARQVETIRDDQAHVVGCWWRLLGRDDKHIVDVNDIHERSFDRQDLISNGPGVAHGSVLMRRDAVESVGGYRTSFTYSQDFDLWLRLVDAYGPSFMTIVPEVLYARRISADHMLKWPVQRAYAKVARESARHRARDEHFDVEAACDSITGGPPTDVSARERDALYHYLAGVYLQEHGSLTRARSRLARSISRYPFQVRGWYRLGLSFLPASIRPRIRRAVTGMARR